MKASLLIISACLFFACHPESESDQPVPDNILSEEQFIQVLTDSYLAESAAGINVKVVSGDKIDSTYMFNPLKDNNISKEKYDSTVNYYTRHPKKFKIIYDKVLAKMSMMQAKGKIE
ncbi:MAG: hypothetical protein K0R26_1510 [Bacteroidota bacterium]|jgi:hypothetical protein|nr:hypothetical protein [Bacteroidota bacterium]